MYKGAIFEAIDSIKRYFKVRKERMAAQDRLYQLEKKRFKEREFQRWKLKLEEDIEKGRLLDKEQLDQFRTRLAMLTDEES